MKCLAATYEWKSSTTADTNATSASHQQHQQQKQQQQPCRCLEMSSAELELQQMAKAELALLRDRVRKISQNWLDEPQARKATAAPVRFEWKIEPTDLVRRLCYWQHTSALTKIGMTPCLAEHTRQHRRLEGTSAEPPALKNKLTLVVWNLAATVQAKLREWQVCVEAEAEEAFVGSIVLRTSDLVPLWMWEADLLRHRPALVDVCDRMISMELWQYRKQCNQLSKREKKLARGGQVTPYLTPFGLRWPPAAGTPNSTKAARTSLGSASSSTAPIATTRSRLKLSKPWTSSKSSEPSNLSEPSELLSHLSDLRLSKASKPAEASKPSKLQSVQPSKLSEFSKPLNSKRSKVSSAVNTTKVFVGETFCVSGPFTVDQEAMLALISSHGGSVASTVNRVCTYLVADQIGSAKTRKAQAKGIPIVSEDWVRTSIEEGEMSRDPSLFLSGCSKNKQGPSSKVAQRTSDNDEDDDEVTDGHEMEQSENTPESESDLSSSSARESNGESDEASEDNDEDAVD